VRINIWRNAFIELTNLVLADSRLMMYSHEAVRLSAGWATSS
jgi:hypothetical protein